MRRIFRIVCFSVIFISNCNSVFAWNDEITHRDLSQIGTQKSVLNVSFGDYLKRLGYINGTDEVFSLSESPKKVWEWIGDGAVEEDAGNVFTASYYNHFHNPRFAWSEAGLNTLYPYINGISSVLWAQDDAANPWSWQRARDYYRLALSSSTKAERDANFANAFKGVGHMIHLIQDAAQPAHVRNDPHPLDDNGVVPGFEYWAKNPLNQAYVSNLMQSPAFPSLDLNTVVGGYVPITQFIDTDQGGGISEYTNANFFSEDTIFTEPSPSWAEAIEYEETVNGETRIYLKSTSINHLAATRWFYLYLSDGYKRYGLKLDDAVYSDYAALLIPRAVGYSSGLINYFFRGQIDMKPDTENAGKYTIKNLSSETMSGAFSLYYDDANGNRKLVQGADLSAANNVSIAPGTSSASIPPFTEPTDAKEKGKYMLVFFGTLGAEEGAVAGRVVTLAKGKWEDWDRGVYEATYRYSGNGHTAEAFFLQTAKHTWYGDWDAEGSPPANIRVEDGLLKIDAGTGSTYPNDARGQLYTYDDNKDIPVANCKFKMNIPHASIGHNQGACGPNMWCDYSHFTIMLIITDGTRNFYMSYGISEGSTYWDCGRAYNEVKPTYCTVFVGGGEIERNMEDDFRWRVGEIIKRYQSIYPYSLDYWQNYIGDMSKWHVKGIYMYYNFDNMYPNNNMDIAIDYVDFVCGEGE